MCHTQLVCVILRHLTQILASIASICRMQIRGSRLTRLEGGTMHFESVVRRKRNGRLFAPWMKPDYCPVWPSKESVGTEVSPHACRDDEPKRSADSEDKSEGLTALPFRCLGRLLRWGRRIGLSGRRSLILHRDTKRTRVRPVGFCRNKPVGRIPRAIASPRHAHFRAALGSFKGSFDRSKASERNVECANRRVGGTELGMRGTYRRSLTRDNRGNILA